MIKQEHISPESGNEKLIKELTFEKLRDRIIKSRDHTEFSKYIDSLIDIPEAKNKIKNIIKDYLSKLESFDIENKVHVTMVQILARTFWLQVYVDGLYGKQTLTAISDIMKLNRELDPPIINLPVVDENKLANYRKGKDEQEAVKKLKNEFAEFSKDPQKIESFEKELRSYKVDIQTAQIKVKWLTIDTTGKPESRKAPEVFESVESKIDKVIKRIFRLSPVEATYNKIENKIYLNENGNPKYPIIIDIWALWLDASSPKFAQELELKLKLHQNSLDDFKLPEWANEKRWDRFSAADRIEKWEKQIPLDIDTLIKIQKLKNIITKVHESNIDTKYKINLVDKYMYEGWDATGRVIEAISLIEFKNEILLAYPSGNRKFINERFLEPILDSYTTFKINTNQYISWIWLLIGWDISKKELNIWYINKISNLLEWKKGLFEEIATSFIKFDKINWSLDKKLNNLLDNLSFIKEYSEFDCNSLNPNKDPKLTKFFNDAKIWLDNYVMNWDIKDAKLIFWDIKNGKINELFNDVVDPKLKNTLITQIWKWIANWSFLYDHLIATIKNAKEIKRYLSENNFKNIDKSKVDKILPIILRGEIDARELPNLNELDDKITSILAQENKYQNIDYIKQRIEGIFSKIIEWEYGITNVLNNIEKVANFNDFNKHEEIYSRLINDLFKNGNFKVFDSEILAMQNNIKSLKEDKSLTVISPEKKYELLLGSSTWLMQIERFDIIVANLHDLQKQFDSWKVTIEEATIIVSSLISDNASVTWDVQWELTYECPNLPEKKQKAFEKSLSNLKDAKKKLEDLSSKDASELTNEDKEDVSFLKDVIKKILLAFTKIWAREIFIKDKKLSTSDYEFIANDFLDKNSQKYKIPKEAFTSKEIREEYEKVIKTSLLSWEIKEKDVKYIFGELLNVNKWTFKKFMTLSTEDKQALFQNIITGTLSNFTNSDTMGKKDSGHTLTLESRVNFILDNYNNLDKFNNFPEWVNTIRYKEIVLAIRSSYLSWYLPTNEKFNELLTAFNDKKLSNLSSNTANWLKAFSDYYTAHMENKAEGKV
ncbi:MAG: hypothetical protein ACD_3C00027G0005 [uncultured bacterium (gcode 4)]|uniref:Uncharacterized protein n=1 Tax=uncultured bacterium (gcode 4) TaxID=1234023 RepID=K2G343_9BACT|nr:MAG: hypothetical protein ACD_3C00027G0005 [uncultured bacterium (gcode 4)]